MICLPEDKPNLFSSRSILLSILSSSKGTRIMNIDCSSAYFSQVYHVFRLIEESFYVNPSQIRQDFHL